MDQETPANTSRSDLIEAYNYDTFVEENFARWMRFETSPPLGEPAPDFPLTQLDGGTTRLSEVWRQARLTIVEFGSFT